MGKTPHHMGYQVVSIGWTILVYHNAIQIFLCHKAEFLLEFGVSNNFVNHTSHPLGIQYRSLLQTRYIIITFRKVTDRAEFIPEVQKRILQHFIFYTFFPTHFPILI